MTLRKGSGGLTGKRVTLENVEKKMGGEQLGQQV